MLPGRRWWWLLGAAGLVVVLGVGTLLVAARELQRPLAVPEPPALLEVRKGASLSGVAEEMGERGWLSPLGQLALRIYGRHTGIAHELQAGDYAVTEGLSARALIHRVAAGRVVYERVTLVEGWTFARALEALQAHDAIESRLDPDQAPERLAAELGLEADHPEGWFYPTTYRFARGSTDRDILQAAHERMRERLAEAWSQRRDDLALEAPYEALILASIIERETGEPGERRKVAGVFNRRLEQGMRLQADPTVIYGLGEDFEGRLRRRDLERDTPYNTYRRDGLPPTPIALPGSAALEAAVDPESGDALYFVSRGDGTHHFSETLEEHNAAVRRYILGEEP